MVDGDHLAGSAPPHLQLHTQRDRGGDDPRVQPPRRLTQQPVHPCDPPSLNAVDQLQNSLLGVSKPASRVRAHSTSSPSVTVAPGCRTTTAVTASPQRSCGRPITAALATCGCSCSSASTRMLETFSPPLLMMSL